MTTVDDKRTLPPEATDGNVMHPGIRTEQARRTDSCSGPSISVPRTATRTGEVQIKAADGGNTSTSKREDSGLVIATPGDTVVTGGTSSTAAAAAAGRKSRLLEERFWAPAKNTIWPDAVTCGWQQTAAEASLSETSQKKFAQIRASIKELQVVDPEIGAHWEQELLPVIEKFLREEDLLAIHKTRLKKMRRILPDATNRFSNEQRRQWRQLSHMIRAVETIPHGLWIDWLEYEQLYPQLLAFPRCGRRDRFLIVNPIPTNLNMNFSNSNTYRDGLNAVDPKDSTKTPVNVQKTLPSQKLPPSSAATPAVVRRVHGRRDGGQTLVNGTRPPSTFLPREMPPTAAVGAESRDKHYLSASLCVNPMLSLTEMAAIASRPSQPTFQGAPLFPPDGGRCFHAIDLGGNTLKGIRLLACQSCLAKMLGTACGFVKSSTDLPARNSRSTENSSGSESGSAEEAFHRSDHHHSLRRAQPCYCDPSNPAHSENVPPNDAQRYEDVGPGSSNDARGSFAPTNSLSSPSCITASVPIPLRFIQGESASDSGIQLRPLVSSMLPSSSSSAPSRCSSRSAYSTPQAQARHGGRSSSSDFRLRQPSRSSSSFSWSSFSNQPPALSSCHAVCSGRTDPIRQPQSLYTYQVLQPVETHDTHNPMTAYHNCRRIVSSNPLHAAEGGCHDVVVSDAAPADWTPASASSLKSCTVLTALHATTENHKWNRFAHHHHHRRHNNRQQKENLNHHFGEDSLAKGHSPPWDTSSATPACERQLSYKCTCQSLGEWDPWPLPEDELPQRIWEVAFNCRR